jgi:hypothetical protein
MTKKRRNVHLWDGDSYFLEKMSDILEKMEVYYRENQVTTRCCESAEELDKCKTLARKIARLDYGLLNVEAADNQREQDLDMLFSTIRQRIDFWWN